MNRIAFAFAPLLLALSHGASATCAGFADVDGTSPFCANLVWIKNRNITQGCAPGLYCPGDAVSRLAMAAFLNRLGDVLVPPNVIWVAPAGGRFQSIQAAIDFAAGSATASTPQLVKLAPGVYNEQVTMVPYVDVEGSGATSSTISSAVCPAQNPPTVATVTGASNAQLRKVTIQSTGAGNDCLAVYLGNVAGAPLRDVTIQGMGGIDQRTGIRAVLTTNSAVLENVNINITSPTLAINYGVRASGTGGTGRLTLRNSQVNVVAPANIQGVSLTDVKAVLERVSISTTATMGPNGGWIAMEVGGASADVEVRDSASRGAGGWAINVHSSGTARVAGSLLDGTVTGVTSCFHNYDAAFAAVTC